MTPLQRRVVPELLDSLMPQDPKALRARRDLRRVHLAMGSLAILRSAIAGLALQAPPRRIIELGSGDGTLMLRLARAMRSRWPNVELTLVDQVDVVEANTRREYRRLGWSVQVLREDIVSWANSSDNTQHDLCVTNLFLHHFEKGILARILEAVAARAVAFVACEPRRNRLSRLSGHCVALIGGSSVTREDAVKSVEAGFNGQDLSDCWGSSAGAWNLSEHFAFPFTHCFCAVRRRPSPA